MTARPDPHGPLANSVRHALDRRASLTGEPNSEQRDEMAERERVAERAYRDVVVEMVKGLEDIASYASIIMAEPVAAASSAEIIHGTARALLAAARAAGIGATPAPETNFHEWPDY